MHASREPTPRRYIRRCQTRYSEPSLYLYGYIEDRERRRISSGSVKGRGEGGSAYAIAGVHAWACTCYPLLRAVMHRWRYTRARARAYRSPRPTHKSDVSADGICRYGRCLSFSLSSLPPRSLSLSLSVLAERRAKVEREKFRAFRETDFIRGCALTRAADTPSNGRKLSETRRNPAISRYTPSVLPNFCAASLSRPCKLSRGRTKRSRRIS